MIDITFELNEKDYYKFNVHMFYGGHRKLIVVMAIVVFLSLFGLNIYEHFEYGLGFDMITTLVYILFIVFFIVFLPLILWFSARRAFKNDLQDVNEQNFLITDNGIGERIGIKEAILPWVEIFKINETKNHFFVFVDKNQAFIIPKRSFDDNKLEEAKNCFEENLDKEKYKRKK